MYKTGDILKNLEKLNLELKQIKYPDKLPYETIQDGNPLMFLPILHFTLLSYSKFVAQFLLDNEYELFSKSDKEFINKIFKALIDLFNYKPTLNPRQFFLPGYTEAKVIFCLEVIRIVKQEHNNLLKKAYSVNVLKANKSNSKSKNKVNDSFRSLKQEKNDLVGNEYNSNSNIMKNIRVVNHAKEQKKKDLSPDHQKKYENEINSYIQLASPKFNDDEQIDYNANKKYKFNTEFVRSNKVNLIPKETDLKDVKDFTDQREAQNYYKEENKNEDLSVEENMLLDIDGEDDENNAKQVYKEEDKFINRPYPNTLHNNYSNMPPKANPSIPSAKPFDFTQLVDIINNLATSVKEMTGRMDTFKNNIEDRVNKLEADISLIKNKVNILEANSCSFNANINSKVNHNESSHLNENNDYVFSFADDHHILTQSNRMNKVEDMRDHSFDNNVKYDTMKNKRSAFNSIQNQNQNDNRPSNTQNNKLPSKIMNDIEDTDSIIERVANRFKETQKLLNEFK